MPVMDGPTCVSRYRTFEAAHRQALKAGGREAKKPLFIVGMSAKDDVETRREVASAGMSVFIPKPFRYPDLLALVFQHLGVADDDEE